MGAIQINYLIDNLETLERLIAGSVDPKTNPLKTAIARGLQDQSFPIRLTLEPVTEDDPWSAMPLLAYENFRETDGPGCLWAKGQASIDVENSTSPDTTS